MYFSFLHLRAYVEGIGTLCSFNCWHLEDPSYSSKRISPVYVGDDRMRVRTGRTMALYRKHWVIKLIYVQNKKLRMEEIFLSWGDRKYAWLTSRHVITQGSRSFQLLLADCCSLFHWHPGEFCHVLRHTVRCFGSDRPNELQGQYQIIAKRQGVAKLWIAVRCVIIIAVP